MRHRRTMPRRTTTAAPVIAALLACVGLGVAPDVAGAASGVGGVSPDGLEAGQDGSPEGRREGPPPMTPEDVVSLRRPSDPRIAPAGDRVLLVVRESDVEANEVRRDLWIHDEAAGGARQLTRSGSDSRPRWLPDGSGFVFLSERSGSSQVWLMSTDGGEPRRLTGEGSGVDTFELSPDGRRLAFTAVALEATGDADANDAGSAAASADDDAGDDTEAAADGATGSEPRSDAYVFDEPRDLPALWLLQLGSGERSSTSRSASAWDTRWDPRAVVRLSPEGLAVQALTWAPDGSRLVVAARPSTILDRVGETELYLVDPSAPGAGSDAFRRLTDNAVPESGIAFADDGTVLFTAADAERFVNAESKLFRLDPATGEIDRLATEYTYGLDAPQARDDAIYALSGVRASRRLVRLDPGAGEPQSLAGEDGTVLAADVAADGTVAYLYTDADELPALWIRDPSGDARRVFELNAGRAWALGDTRAITWASTDGSEVEGLLTLPVGHDPGRRVPLVVSIHGGPEAAHTLAFDPDYMDYAQVMAGRGWAVLRPNYRGGTNYGDAWVQGMNADSGGGDYEDIVSGVDHLIAVGIADADRLAVMGWSWGGISTGWIVTQTDRFAAASAGAMVSNHFSVFGQADLTFDVELFYIGGSPWEDPARYLRHSPIGHVMKATTPTLLLHGEEDERCPLPQSVEFYKGLRAAGVEARLVVYPREPHVFREPLHRLDKMRREIAWFAEHGLR